MCIRDRYLERLLQENVLTREDGDIHCVGNLLQQFRLLPGDHVLQPREVVLGQRLAQPDATVDAQGSEMIGGEWNVHSHHLCLLYTSDAADDLTRVDLG